MKKLLLFVVVMNAACLHSALAEGKEAILPVDAPHAVQPGGEKLWRFSIAAVAAASVMDAHSSWGKRELNRNLAGNAGQFGREGALIKFGILGGVCTLEYLVLHRSPSGGFYRRLSFINFGGAAVTGGMAIRNYGIPRSVK